MLFEVFAAGKDEFILSKSFMYDLCFGNLVPWERGRAQDPDYTSLTRKIGEIKVHFASIKNYAKQNASWLPCPSA